MSKEENNILPPDMAEHLEVDTGRRDFMSLAAGAVTCVGAGAALWPLIDSMNPSQSVRSMSSLEVNIKNIPQGQAVTVMYQGKPLFIRHRTPDDIKLAQDVKIEELRDPQDDKERVLKSEWLVVSGVCTHLGCIPSGQKVTDSKGDFDGWLCPCHGSHYDSSGRIRKGPAPKNLPVPEYAFLDDHTIRITSRERKK